MSQAASEQPGDSLSSLSQGRAMEAFGMRAKTPMTPSRMLWSRALPGTVMVVAALALPEFSVGAGDLPDGRSGLAAVREPASVVRLPIFSAPEAAPLIALPARPASRSGADAFDLNTAPPSSAAGPLHAFANAFPAPSVEQPAVAAVSAPQAPSVTPSAGQSSAPSRPSLPQTELSPTVFTGPLTKASLPLDGFRPDLPVRTPEPASMARPLSTIAVGEADAPSPVTAAKDRADSAPVAAAPAELAKPVSLAEQPLTSAGLGAVSVAALPVVPVVAPEPTLPAARASSP
ncbi:hypothetical protein OIK40_12105 [Erythrobacter sp. sf7]|uniref:Fe-S oxidoreductase n=1 Tax=Erythrobacter fulvus TaxID=2987523 RepID=A0ABT5JTE4_9SPHN|nr:hypothetical protein [Erythrobacter fulvus]MDC8755383.1 hypothetical protein [Erythrobacter fulvus]